MHINIIIQDHAWHSLNLRERLRTAVRGYWLPMEPTIWCSTGRRANTDIALKGATSCHDLCTSNVNTQLTL